MKTIDPVATGGIRDSGLRGGGWGLGLLRERFPCGTAWGTTPRTAATRPRRGTVRTAGGRSWWRPTWLPRLLRRHSRTMASGRARTGLGWASGREPLRFARWPGEVCETAGAWAPAGSVPLPVSRSSWPPVGGASPAGRRCAPGWHADHVTPVRRGGTTKPDQRSGAVPALQSRQGGPAGVSMLPRAWQAAFLARHAGARRDRLPARRDARGGQDARGLPGDPRRRVRAGRRGVPDHRAAGAVG